MATALLTTTPSTITHTSGSHVLVTNVGGYDAILTCRGVDYRCTPADPDGVAVPARGAAVTGRTEAGTTTVSWEARELRDVADGGSL